MCLAFVSKMLLGTEQRHYSFSAFTIFANHRHNLEKMAIAMTSRVTSIKSYNHRDFPGCPVVRALHFHCRGHRFDSWSGN